MIMTVEELKKYVDTEEKDSVLEAKLQALELLIRKYTNNNFQDRNRRFVVAEPKTESEPTGWTVSVNNNAAYCGIGAGGVQFANGKAEITSKRMADWFMEHDGYTVIPKK